MMSDKLYSLWLSDLSGKLLASRLLRQTEEALIKFSEDSVLSPLRGLRKRKSILT